MAKLRFLPADRAFEVRNEQSVLELALKHKVDIEHSCGGSGSCGTCHIFVRCVKAQLPPRNDIEEAMAQDRGFANNERLACQIDPIDGLEVTVPTYLDLTDE